MNYFYVTSLKILQSSIFLDHNRNKKSNSKKLIRKIIADKLCLYA